jgi:hypothetical protein
MGVDEKKLTLTSSFLDLKICALMLEYPANTIVTMAIIFFIVMFLV